MVGSSTPSRICTGTYLCLRNTSLRKFWEPLTAMIGGEGWGDAGKKTKGFGSGGASQQSELFENKFIS